MEGLPTRLLVALAAVWLLSGCHVLVHLGEDSQQQGQGETDPSQDDPPAVSANRPSPALSADLPNQGPDATNASPTRSGRARPAARDQPQPTSVPANKTSMRSRLLSTNTGINTNTAIAPGEGQYVYRTQLRFLEAHSTPATAETDVNLLVNPHVLAYGVRENFTLFGVVPVVLRKGTVRPPAPPGAFVDLDDQGFADLQFFGKYRFWERDLPGRTYRWSALAGIEVPTFDKDFSSESWNPFLGTVWTYQSQEWGLDLDLVWQFNTGTGLFRQDELAYDAAYTYVLVQGQTLDERFWQLNSVFEVNGFYSTDGSHLVFASPGFQLALERMIVEGSLQLPVIRDLKSGIEPDFVFAVGTRITW